MACEHKPSRARRRHASDTLGKQMQRGGAAGHDDDSIGRRRPAPASPPRDGARETLSDWLAVGEGAALLGVALILLLTGIVVIVDTLNELLRALAMQNIAEVIFSIAENALLALILAELVHTLLLPIRGHTLTPEPFLVIAIVAILRKMLLATVITPKTAETGALLSPLTAELLALGFLILLLGGALALLRVRR
jgi:uncharacterized membrane protein (DUF373 family)